MNPLLIGAINTLCEDCYTNSKAHGFWEKERNKPEMLMLMVSEIAEALEYLRHNGAEYCPNCPSKITSVTYRQGRIVWWLCAGCGHTFEGREPKEILLESDHIPFAGVEEEMADVLVRVFDFCGGFNLRLGEALVAKMQFNKTRPHKHGKTL